MHDTDNYNTSFIGQLDKINNDATDRIRIARTQKACDEILSQRRKDVAALLKRYDPEGQFKSACKPLLRKLAYGTTRIDGGHSNKLARSSAAGAARPRDSRRAAQKKKEKGDGSSGEDGPCPDPDVSSNIIKTSLGCSQARQIRKVGTSTCPNHFTCPMALLSRNRTGFIYLADSRFILHMGSRGTPYRFAVARRFSSAGSSRRPK